MYNGKPFNWGPALFLIIFQAFVLIFLPIYFYYHTPYISTCILGFVLLYATGLSITGGYHRYYAHKTYRTNHFVEGLLLFFGSMAVQGSALRWAFDHRLHHAYVDTDEDPYSINKGFWYAHFLWILEKPRTIEPKLVSDLLKNKMVVFQHKNYKMLMVATNLIVFLFFGWLLNDYLGVFAIAVALRIFTLLHCTWFINSLAHTWGDKPFCKEQSAVNNYVLSLLTFGEGYHNYHHTFANDYRNGVRWYHFDPTKWLIWTLDKLGLAYGLKRMDFITIRKRLISERKNLLLERLKDLCYVKRDEIEKMVQDISDGILEKLSEFSHLKEKYSLTKMEKASVETLQELKKEIKAMRKSLQQDWRLWLKVSRSIMHMKELPLTV